MNRIDRNKILVRHLINKGVAKSQKEIGVLLGYKNESAFSQVVNEKVPYPKDFMEKLISLEPKLNARWLKFGDGEMLDDSSVTAGKNVVLTNVQNTGRDAIITNSIGDGADLSALKAEVSVLRAENSHLQHIIAEKDALIKEKERLIGVLMGKT